MIPILQNTIPFKQKHRLWRTWYWLSFVFLLTGCVTLPDNVKPIRPFMLERYLGTWFEIARLDHRFERGLSHISATYTLRDDGSVRVLNRGYDTKNKTWKQAEGRAYFVNEPDTAFLKVSFFGPFFGAYIVFDLDTEHYQYALVSGPDTSYLWLLARTPNIDEVIKTRLINKAKAAGFDTQSLIFVDHSPF